MLASSFFLFYNIFRVGGNMTTIYLINNSLTMNNLSFPDKELLEQNS